LLYIEFFWTFGTLLVPLFAWYSLENNNIGQEGSWELFCVLCAVPCIVSTILGIIIVPESPRWLLTKGKHEKALSILRYAATKNGLDSDAVFPLGIHLTQHEVETKSSTLLDLFSQKWRRTTLLLWMAWFSLAFLYYGAILAISIVFTRAEEENNNGKGYRFDYQAIFISAISEIVGLFLVLSTIDRCGRIPTQTLTYILGGVSCLILGYSAHFGASRNVLIAFAFVARLAMMGATGTTWVSTSEILTTDIRATGHGYANAMGRIGGFFCPYIISESFPLHHIGLFLFLVSSIAAAAVSQLPETCGQRLGSSQNKSLGQGKSHMANGTDSYIQFEL